MARLSCYRYEKCEALQRFFKGAKLTTLERTGDSAKVSSAMRKLTTALEDF
jgi:hypothetical protein